MALIKADKYHEAGKKKKDPLPKKGKIQMTKEFGAEPLRLCL